ncbi:MAG: dihydrodipicolinate synthase family protein, partial [Oscillospiraceae bacterium]|nr:dihydrodipicolinate synthase family protein [Oscillospiraceae bacterium]
MKIKKKATPYRVISLIVLVIFALLFLFPLYWIVTGAFKPTTDIYSTSTVWWPTQWVLRNFKELFSGRSASLFTLLGIEGPTVPAAIRWLLNSVFISAAAMLLTCITAAMAGYALAKKRFIGRNVLFALIVCAMALARHAESLGVDTIAAIPPIYFHLPEYAIAQYWNDISTAAPNTDFVIYNIPQLAGVALTMPLFRKMLKNPNVVAVKNSSMPVQDIQMFKDEGTRNGRSFVVFNGPDEQLVSGLAMGADGGIGGTYGFMPELILKIFALVNAGDLAAAKALQYDVDNIIYATCATKGNMYAVIKEILRRREGLDIGGVPRPAVQPGQRGYAPGGALCG